MKILIALRRIVVTLVSIYFIASRLTTKAIGITTVAIVVLVAVFIWLASLNNKGGKK
jgi:hypothetical protein